MLVLMVRVGRDLEARGKVGGRGFVARVEDVGRPGCRLYWGSLSVPP